MISTSSYASNLVQMKGTLFNGHAGLGSGVYGRWSASKRRTRTTIRFGINTTGAVSVPDGPASDSGLIISVVVGLSPIFRLLVGIIRIDLALFE